jgi:hypothetical protein
VRNTAKADNPSRMEWIMNKNSIKTPVLKIKTVVKAGGLGGSNHNSHVR